MSTHDEYNDYDSEDDEDFNPAPVVGSDDEGAPADAEEDGPKQARSRPQHDDDEDEEDDEEDEDEEDEDDIQSGRPRKRHRAKGNAFIDIEAEVDDEDEGEDDEAEGEEIKDFIDHSHPDEMAEADRLGDDLHHRELDQRRQMEASMDAEKQAELLKQRYGKRHRTKGLADGNVVPKRLLLPSVDDPSIWAVKCKEGKEAEVIFSIMKKVEESVGTAHQVGITSAFERGGPDSVMKGIIYVEAQRKNDIVLALDGMLNVYVHSKMHLVDIKEMPDLLRIKKTEPLQPGAWVRLRRPPKHSGDLAQVINITDNGLEARVRFVPRIDWAGLGSNSRFGAGKRKRPPFGAGPRPPQRLFSQADAKKHDPRGRISYNQNGASVIYNGDEFEDGGLQVKDVRIQQLQTAQVNASLDEVTKFAANGEEGMENLDLTALAAGLRDGANSAPFLPGDMVEVYEGEQKGVVGKATNVVGSIVTLKVSEGALNGQVIEVPTQGLRKRFSIGDHVKVVGGSRFREEVGMVVKIDNDRVTMLTDQTSAEITVFSRDLREASDTGGQGSLGQYALLDLVQVDPVTVGCIVKVDRESLGILDQNSEVRTMTPSQIANRIPKRKHTVAADRNGAEIKVDDVVKEYAGQHRKGKIIHVHRSFVFLHTIESTENAGVFVVRANNVTSVAAKDGRVAVKESDASGGPDLSAMNPALQRGNKPMAAPTRIVGRDKAIGQTVHVRKGGYKGLLGIVKDATDTHVRLELHTKNKIITIPRDSLVFKDKETGETIDITRRGPAPGRGGGLGAPSGGRDWQGGSTPRGERGSGRSPAWGSATPGGSYGGAAGGSRTPAWNRGDSGRAPAWQDGNRTAYGADGSRTAYGGDGSRTAYGGSGSRTPAWSSNSKTPAHDGFGQGSKTPYGGEAWASGSKTPAYGGSAPTPGASGGDSWGYTPGATGGASAYDAPTPGAAMLSAPTPGAISAPTPGAYSAPTPAANAAPTPGSWQSSSWGGSGGAESAPTPAAGAPTPGATTYSGNAW